MVRQTDKLKPHPANALIYGDKPNKELLDSINRSGILTPLLITWDDRIIAGHRRHQAAQKLKLVEVPVIVSPSRDEDEILEALIGSNRQRRKTRLMIAREAAELAKIEERRAIANQEATQFKPVIAEGEEQPRLPVCATSHKPVHTKIEVADKIGVSPRTAQAAITVGTEILKLESSEEPEDKQRLQELSETVNGRGFEAAAALVPKPATTGRGRPLQMVESTPAASLPTLNRTNKKVDWAWWTWNPVTGCLHDCPYCYARDIANQYYPQKFVPTFHADKLAAPRNTPLPKSDDPGSRRVFTCSMADLFGNWVPQEWIDAVFAEMRDNPQWEFLCLTKFPQRLASLEWPENAWMGTTVDRQYRVEIAEKAFRDVKAGVKWLSCEPMLEPLKFSSLEMFDWVVIGGASRSTQTPESWPDFEWVVDLYNQARAAGCKVWIKPNGIGERTRVPKEIPR